MRLDNYASFQQNTNATERSRRSSSCPITYVALTQHVEVPFYYTDKPGRDNSGGDWKADISDMLVEEIVDSPEVMKNLRLRMSLRFVFPTGGQAPFGSDQWQVAPGADFT